MRLGRWPWRLAMVSAVIGASLVVTVLGATASTATTTSGPTYYLALGGSGSVGEQPTTQAPHGQPTDEGYANDLTASLRSTYPDLVLAKLGCPGETTVTMLDGGGHCRYESESELSDALAFLRQHRSTVLVTVDLGFNNLRPCLMWDTVDQACVDQTLDIVHRQLSDILGALKSAADPSAQIIGVGHYDPYLGSYLRGPTGRAFAVQSIDPMAQLNRVLRTTYAEAGVPMADVSASFGTDETQMTPMASVGSVPMDVARVCDLTWKCAPAPLGPNQHPNDAGYRVISQAIRSAMSPRSITGDTDDQPGT
jgi:lysophospholipase L1-like esterase